MSGFVEQDPGEMRIDELYDREPHGTIVRAMPCWGCRNLDGSIDGEKLDEMEGIGCVFGCADRVSRDFKVCLTCREHSANRVECDVCGKCYEDWTGQWREAQ